MILTGSEIREQVRAGHIWIDPFTETQIQPNSYDFRLGPRLGFYTDDVLDVRRDNAFELIDIPATGYVIDPSRIHLGHTLETMGSDCFVPIIRGRSSIARLGLFVHVTADIIDLGSRNQWTLQLHAVQPMRVYPDMLIGQVTFWCVQGEKSLYTGKYQGSIGPYSSRSHLDFDRKERAEHAP